MSVTLYGLKACDTCRKALKAISDGGLSARFVDVRAEADLAVLLPGWLSAVGGKALLNRASTTWRGLSPDQQAEAETEAGLLGLLTAHPALIKRPVIETGETLLVGWTPSSRAMLGL